MNILSFLSAVVGTYYLMAIIQTVLHRIFGHKNRIKRIFTNHAIGHHSKYPLHALQTERYIDSETYVMFYYLVPTALIGVGVYLAGGGVVLGGYAIGVVFAFWWHLFLHKHYHLAKSPLDRYGWFRHKRALHFVHHRHVRKNYAIVEYWIDHMMGTREDAAV